MNNRNLKQQNSTHFNESILQDEQELPQPENSNHLSTAPLKDKLLTNSSYLAAEIPLKLGHFMSNLWSSSTELTQSCVLDSSDNPIWLLGCSYSVKPLDKLQQDILDAQNEEMFNPLYQEKETFQQPVNLNWPPDFYDDFTSRIWMTYRHNYPPMRPSNHKTDIGWGCMLRSGQSLLANTLIHHLLSRSWRRQKQTQKEKELYKKIIQWFLDELSPRAPFSIHRIALLGKQLGKNIGEWFGPSTISQVIQALVSDFKPAQLAVYVATDGVIYTDDIHKSRGKSKSELSSLDLDKEAKTIYDESHPTEDLIESIPIQTRFKSLLILIPVRLGIDSFHPTYVPALKACFELPSFVGIAGGRPNSSLYFIGLEGDDLIYLDPHFSRPALETKNLKSYTVEDFNTYHCQQPRKIHISNIDPSMMIGFYCRNQKEFDLFHKQMDNISKQYTPIFSIQKTAPEYDEDILDGNDFDIESDEPNSMNDDSDQSVF